MKFWSRRKKFVLLHLQVTKDVATVHDKCLVKMEKASDLYNGILREREYSFNCYYTISFGEGNGTPLQYSCLENPMDGGAW